MKEHPLQIIEDYLMLVWSHLPPSTAEDVIDELRDYLVDAATELGEGVVTLKSAKRAVARMGAPSEVAKEYAASLINEAEAQKVSAARTDALESLGEREAIAELGSGAAAAPTPSTAALVRDAERVGGEETQSSNETTIPMPVEPTTYESAVIRMLIVLGLFSLIAWLVPLQLPTVITFLGAWVILLELPAAMAILGARLAQLYRRRDSLMRVSYHNPVKRLLSVPRKLDPFVSRRMILPDLCLTIGFTTIVFGGFILGGLERVSSLLACGLLFARIALLVLRAESLNLYGRNLMRVQLFLQVATVVALSFTAELSYYYYVSYTFGYSLTPYLSTIAAVLAAYMLAVSTVQVDYLWGMSAFDESLIDKHRAEYRRATTAPTLSPRAVAKRITESADMTGTRPALRVVSTFFSCLLWMFYSLALLPIGLAALGGTATWSPERMAVVSEVLLFTFVLVFLVMWPIVMYLGVRWALLRRGRTRVLIGFRSRPEAVVDTVVAALLSVLVLYTYFSTSFQAYLWTIVTTPAGEFHYVLLHFTYMSLVVGLIIRVGSDMVNAVTSDSRLASSTLRASCFFIMTAIGGFVGEGIIAAPYNLNAQYIGASLLLALPAALMSLQAVTSGTKLRGLLAPKPSGSVVSHVSSESSEGVTSVIAAFRVLRRKTVSLALVWPLVSFIVTLLVVDAVVLSQYPAWEVVILANAVYTGLAGALAIVYFGARRAMILAGEADTVIGGRGKAEAGLDIAAIITLLVVAGYTYNRLYYSWHSSLVTIDMGLALFLHAVFSAAFIVGALLRAAADMAFIVSRRRVIPRTVFLISGVLLLGGIAFVIPQHVATLDLGWTALWLAIAALLNLQVVTSLAALDELSLQRTPIVMRERQNDGYPPGMAIPTN